MTATALAYLDLKDIDDVAPLSADDDACLQELREVLRKHGRLDRFGVTLLHQQFPIEENEVLVETSDSDPRELRMTVKPSIVLTTERLVKTAWRLQDGAAITGCYNACVAAGGGHTRRHIER
ncbi:hypothetical protein [Tardiphaga sp. P5_C7]